MAQRRHPYRSKVWRDSENERLADNARAVAAMRSELAKRRELSDLGYLDPGRKDPGGFVTHKGKPVRAGDFVSMGPGRPDARVESIELGGFTESERRYYEHMKAEQALASSHKKTLLTGTWVDPSPKPTAVQKAAKRAAPALPEPEPLKPQPHNTLRAPLLSAVTATAATAVSAPKTPEGAITAASAGLVVGLLTLALRPRAPRKLKLHERQKAPESSGLWLPILFTLAAGAIAAAYFHGGLFS